MAFGTSLSRVCDMYDTGRVKTSYQDAIALANESNPIDATYQAFIEARRARKRKVDAMLWMRGNAAIARKTKRKSYRNRMTKL